MPDDPPSSPLFFTDHRDVKAYLNRAEAKNHATTYDLNRDKYVVLLQVTDTGLENIAL